MLSSGDVLVDQILLPFVLWIFIVAGFAGIVLGVSLIVSGASTVRALARMNRWVSLRGGLRPMEKPHDIGAAVYRRRRWFGVAFAIGGAFTVFMLLFQVETAAVAAGLADGSRRIVVEWAVESLKWLLITGGVLAIVTGAMLVVSPGALHALESCVNRWYSPRQLGKGADTMHLSLDRWFEAHPRTAGSLLTVSAAIVLIASMIVWMGN
ncbi:MAG TPA: hypothetical protein VMP00_02185 [Burkholderiales bacterium]|nr:hypothetical protein [Burkholderiales bacterium]